MLISYICADLENMKNRGLFIFIFFLFGVFAYSFTQAKPETSLASLHSSIIIKSSGQHFPHNATGDSPFIRFHHGISESSVSVTSTCQSIIPLKPVNIIPEKFAGIIGYISSLYLNIAPGEVFLYSRPLRSPPFFC